MAKKRKVARAGVRKNVAKRSARSAKGKVVTAKLKGRRRVLKPKTAKRKGVLANALGAVADAVSLRTRLGGRSRFEDQ